LIQVSAEDRPLPPAAPVPSAETLRKEDTENKADDPFRKEKYGLELSKSKPAPKATGFIQEASSAAFAMPEDAMTIPAPPTPTADELRKEAPSADADEEEYWGKHSLPGAGEEEALQSATALADRVDAEESSMQMLHEDVGEKKPTQEEQVKVDATNAHRAAATAKQAAHVATKVAEHSVKMTEHAKSALKNAHDALHKARVNSEGLTREQKESLKKAEKKLREATKDAEYGKMKQAKYIKAEVENKKLAKLDKKMQDAKDQDTSELEAMRKEIEELRKALEAKGDSSDDDALKELEEQIGELEKAEKQEDKKDSKSHDEMKAEIERLREQIKKLEKLEKDEKPEKEEKPEKHEGKKPKEHKMKASDDGDDDSKSESKAVRVSSKDLDVDTQMPYGDLEPFGREDTAQELTEDSIKESDEMVDQLERAEVAEEKRAVFRALTRLRGAAITSFDGVARSQTGNIDEYNKINQWRTKHPLHHLADEESDVAKWAFPQNADFLQKTAHGLKK